VFHLEVLKDERSVYPIELNLRIGGAETYNMVKHAHKIDLAKYILDISLKKEIKI
jgi:biotin carboxylase